MKEDSSNKNASIGFSIVLISFRHDDHFLDACNSVMNQNYDISQMELIIVCKSYGTPVSFLEKEHLNISLKLIIDDDFRQGTKFRKAVEKAKFEWIAVIDDDDLWHPDKLKILSSYIGSDQELQYLHNSKVYVNEHYSFHQLKGDFEESSEDYEKRNFLKSLRKANIDCEHNGSSITFNKMMILGDLDVISRLEGAMDTFLYLCAKGQKLKILCLREKLTYFRVTVDKKDSDKNFNFIANLTRQQKSYRVLYDLQNHTSYSLNIVDIRIITNETKLVLLLQSKLGPRERAILTKRCLRLKLFYNAEGFFLTFLSIISIMSIRIANRLYLFIRKNKTIT
jgi:glycosyltransferase involved in cell wall biosynthesis